MIKHLILLLLLLSSSVGFAAPKLKQAILNKQSIQVDEAQNLLFFEPQRNDISIKNPVYSFDLTNPRRSILGKGEFSSLDFQMRILPFGFKYLNHYQVYNAIGFKWPKDLLRASKVILEDQSGKVLLELDLTQENIDKWQNDLKKVRSDKKVDLYSLGTSTYHRKFSMKGFHIGVVEQKEKPIRLTSKRVRFCVFGESLYNDGKICSDYYSKNGKKEYRRVRRPIKTVKAVSQVNGRTLKRLRGRFPVTSDLKVNLKKRTGFEVDLFIKRPEVNVLELVRKDEKILLYGEGEICSLCKRVTKDTMVVYYNPLFYLDLLNKGRTYNKPKVYWYMEIDQNEDGYSYDQLGKIDSIDFSLDYKKLFTRKDKPKVKPPIRSGTYLSEIDLTLIRPEGIDVFALPGSDMSATQERVWTLKDLERGKNNIRYVAVTRGEEKGILRHSVYRGYATELSGRGTVVTSDTADVSLITEVNLSHWWEDIFWMKSKLLTLQRWGINVKYFNSLIDFELSSGEDLPITSLTADLKYRLTPGLWNRDETYGFSLSYQDIAFGDFYGSMLGAGFTWARSLPKVFDDIVNVIPFMRYPKWVEAEILYYPVPAASRTTGLGLNFSLNYRGKILWSQRFFGEAGFGIKRFDFGDVQENKRVRTFIFYATGGLGFQF